MIFTVYLGFEVSIPPDGALVVEVIIEALGHWNPELMLFLGWKAYLIY